MKTIKFANNGKEYKIIKCYNSNNVSPCKINMEVI